MTRRLVAAALSCLVLAVPSSAAAQVACSELRTDFLFSDYHFRQQFYAPVFQEACRSDPGLRTDSAARAQRGTQALLKELGDEVPFDCWIEKPDRSFCTDQPWTVNVRCRCKDPQGVREVGATVACPFCQRRCDPKEPAPGCQVAGVLQAIDRRDLPPRYFDAVPLRPGEEPGSRDARARATANGFITSGGVELPSRDPGVCDPFPRSADLRTYGYGHCIEDLAVVTGQGELCQRLQDYPGNPNRVSDCALKVGTARGNLGGCFVIPRPRDLKTDGGERQQSFTQCMVHSLWRFPTLEGCQVLQRTLDGDAFAADLCYAQLASSSPAPELCHRVVGAETRAKCFTTVARALGNPELCVQIEYAAWDDCARATGGDVKVLNEKAKARWAAKAARMAEAKKAPPPAPGGDRAGPPDGALRVAMSGQYWPLHAEAGEARYGLEAEVADTLARQLNRTVVFLGRTELGMSPLEAVAAGQADVAISSITPTAERRQRVDFTAPYLKLDYRLLRPRTAPDPKGAPGLGGKRVAVPKGPALADLSTVLSGAKVTPVATLAQGLALLRKKKVAYVAGENLGLLELMDDTKEALGTWSLGGSPLAMAVPKGQAPTYDEALRKIAPAIAEFEQLYRPGKDPETLTLWACDSDAGAPAVRLSAGGQATVDPNVPRPPDAFVVDFSLPGAPRQGSYRGEAGDGPLCISAPARLTRKGTAQTARAIRAAHGFARGELTGPDEKPDRHQRVVHKERRLELDPVPPGFIRLAGGTRVTMLSWELSQTCVEMEIADTHDDSETYLNLGEWDCPASGLVVVTTAPTGATGHALLVTSPAADDPSANPASSR